MYIQDMEQTLRDQLLGDFGREQALTLADYCLAEEARFQALTSYMLGPEEQLARRAAWVFQHAVEKDAQWATAAVPAMVARLAHPAHGAILRAIMRSLYELPLPDALHMPLMEYAFAFLDDPKVPVAVRVFSMSVLERLVSPYPELRRELALVIEAHMPEGSAGFKSRGRRVLKKLAGL